MRRFRKDSEELVKFGVFSGIGASAITKSGGSAAGMSNLTKYSGTLGKLGGAGALFRSLRRFK